MKTIESFAAAGRTCSLLARRGGGLASRLAWRLSARPAAVLASTLALLAGNALAQTLPAGPGIDAQVNAAFAASTGWFVRLIFAPLPGTDFP